MIENILDFSRIEQGRKEFKFEPTDIVDLVEHTVKMIEPYAIERKVSVAVSFDGFDFGNFRRRFSLDGRCVEQALLNLIDNALKHSPEGETVTVGVEVQIPNSPVQCCKKAQGSGLSGKLDGRSLSTRHAPRLLLWVEDRGSGIPVEEHGKIFERFYRLGSELRRETEGVGIGLSIVKHIVEGHGGRIS